MLQQTEEKLSDVIMAVKVFFFFVSIGIASSELPHVRVCDPEQGQDSPTLCSNNENIRFIYEKKKELQKMFDKLNGDVENLSHSANSITLKLDRLEKKFEEAVAGLINSTEKQNDNITNLRNEVDELVKHQERFGGNFSDIEDRLDVTERQLMGKKAKLENLETETEAAFNNTSILLSSYKKELSHLKSTAQDLEVKVEARLNVTKKDLEDKVETIRKNTEAFSTKLHHQKSEFDYKLESKFNKINNELKTQNATLNHINIQTATKLETLRTETEAAFNITKTLLKTQRDELSRLNSTTRGLEAKLDETKMAIKQKLENIHSNITVQKKVAFSATIIESSHSFTGPYSPGSSNILKFDRVFTNIGNAYNKKTGIFTAPVDGVYQFSFMTFGYSSHTSGAILVKNGYYQVSTWEFTGPDTSDTTSNSVILEMNAGDCVNIILWQGGKIHTSVFSGFLIFPLV